MSATNHYKAKVGALSRSRSHDDPELVDARRNLAVAKLEAHAQAVADAWPPLTQEQLDRIAVLLRPAGGGTR